MHGFGEWKVNISRPPGTLGGHVSIYRINSGERTIQVLSVEKGVLIGNTYKRGEPVEIPTFIIDDEMELRGIIAAFQEAGKALGVEMPTESHSAGKLEATEKHLEDMRRLVFSHPEQSS